MRGRGDRVVTPIGLHQVSNMFHDSRRFYGVLECSRMFYHDFNFFKFFNGGGGRGVTPICLHQVSNLFYDSRRFQKSISLKKNTVRGDWASDLHKYLCWSKMAQDPP